jgi:hypothetical protein
MLTDWLMWHPLVESGAVSADWLSLLVVVLVLTALACWGPHFIQLPLVWVRASWRRSWSCGRWLASACIGRPRAAVYKNCLRPLRGVCWPRSLLVWMTVGGSTHSSAPWKITGV